MPSGRCPNLEGGKPVATRTVDDLPGHHAAGHYRLASGSILVPAVLHGTLNAQVGGLPAVLVAVDSPLLGGLMGLGGIIVLWAVALWILRRSDAPEC